MMKQPQKNKQNKLLNIRLLFIMVSMAEIFGTLSISGLLSWLSKMIFKRVIEIPDIIWLLIFSVIIGITVSIVINIILLRPVVKLSKAMKQVAAGDFGIRLKSDNRIQEISDSYDSFNLMVQELEATETLQTDFVANVAHEFKTPINAIEGYATLLSDDEPETPELQRQYAEKILLNTQRLSSLVGNVLLLSKVANQAIPIKQTTFRLDEQIRQALVMLEREWAPKDIEFDVELESVNYTGSEQLLPHVWSNLLGNAVKFTPVGGTIRMELTKQAHGIVFVIEDSGPGITEEVRRHMFDKFYQGDTSHKDEGNGLGLALVKHILDETGGTAAAENGPGGGCRITVTLPDTH